MKRLLASPLRPSNVAGVVGAALAAACASTHGYVPPGPTGGVFVEPSEQLARQIELKAVECEFWSTEEDFVGLCDWFYEVGEPGYESLLDMAAGTSTRARFVALSAFAIIADRRLVQRFREEVPVPEGASLHMSYARALMQMGDFSEVPVLIAGLHDPNPRNRAMAHQSLERATNNDVPFNATGSRAERESTASIWRRWFAARTDDPLLRAELQSEEAPRPIRESEGGAAGVSPFTEDGSTD